MDADHFTELKGYIRVMEKEITSIEEIEDFMDESESNWTKDDYKIKKKALQQLIDSSPEVMKIFEKELALIKQRWCI